MQHYNIHVTSASLKCEVFESVFLLQRYNYSNGTELHIVEYLGEKMFLGF